MLFVFGVMFVVMLIGLAIMAWGEKFSDKTGLIITQVVEFMIGGFLPVTFVSAIVVAMIFGDIIILPFLVTWGILALVVWWWLNIW